MALEPQAALETAVRDAIRTTLGVSRAMCDRMFDGRPPPSCGPIFVAVWSGGRRSQGKAGRTALDQMFTVAVTITARINRPFDRQVIHRDEIEKRMNAIVALIHLDTWNQSVINASNTLAAYRASNPGGILPVGFSEALAWESTEDVRQVDGSWFMAEPEKLAGIAQTAHFAKARHIQAIATAQ